MDLQTFGKKLIMEYPVKAVKAVAVDMPKALYQTEFVQSSKRDLASLRVKVLFAVMGIEIFLVGWICRLNGEMIKVAVDKAKVEVVNMAIGRVMTVFYVTSVMFLICLVSYMMGKSEIKIKAFGQEIAISPKTDKGNGDEPKTS